MQGNSTQWPLEIKHLVVMQYETNFPIYNQHNNNCEYFIVLIIFIQAETHLLPTRVPGWGNATKRRDVSSKGVAP